MAETDWDLGQLTDESGILGRTVPHGRVYVPGDISIDGDALLSGQTFAEGKYVIPSRVTLDSFVQLWKLKPEAIARFARKWGVLAIGDSGRPCTSIAQHPRAPEPLETWRYFSKRAYSVLNIAANLAQGRLGRIEDWTALAGTRERAGAEFIEELGRVSPMSLRIIATHGYPITAKAPRHTVEMERLFLAMEICMWLRLGRVGFLIGTDPPSSKGATPQWNMFINYDGHLLSAIALQLSLCVADAESLYVCSGCKLPYNRLKSVKKPKPGEMNFCRTCTAGGKKARTSLVAADRRRQEKVAEAKRLQAGGMPRKEIERMLKLKPGGAARLLAR